MSSTKVAVVTGANKGIGYGIVKGLCGKFQGTVYLTARDIGRGEAAVLELKKLGLAPVFHKYKRIEKISYFQISDSKINATEPFGEQAETTLSVNYFSTLKLCQALFPLLRNNARVVNISSSGGHLSRIPSTELKSKFNRPSLTIAELNQLMEKFIQDAKNNRHKEEGWGPSAYGMSKVGLSALTKIQQKEFDKEIPNRNISVNSVHPGYVATDLTSHKGVWTVEQGTFAPLFVALEAENMKGQYIWSDGTVEPWDAEKPRAMF